MAGRAQGRNAAMGGGGFHHLALRAADFEASVRFYRDGLGFRHAYGWGEGDSRAAMLDTGDGNYLEIFAGGAQGKKPEGALLHYALRTVDCDAAVERARAVGATITTEPKTLQLQGSPGPITVRIAFCSGPDGEVIEFFQGTDL